MKTKFELGLSTLRTIKISKKKNAVNEVYEQLPNILQEFAIDGYKLNKELLCDSIKECISNGVAAHKNEEVGYGVYVYFCKNMTNGKIDAITIESYCLDKKKKYSVYINTENIIITKRHLDEDVRVFVKGTENGYSSIFNMTDEIADEISNAFILYGFNCNTEAIYHNFYAWKNGFKSGYVIDDTMITSPNGLNQLDYMATTKRFNDVTYIA